MPKFGDEHTSGSAQSDVVVKHQNGSQVVVNERNVVEFLSPSGRVARAEVVSGNRDGRVANVENRSPQPPVFTLTKPNARGDRFIPSRISEADLNVTSSILLDQPLFASPSGVAVSSSLQAAYAKMARRVSTGSGKARRVLPIGPLPTSPVVPSYNLSPLKRKTPVSRARPEFRLTTEMAGTDFEINPSHVKLRDNTVMLAHYDEIQARTLGAAETVTYSYEFNSDSFNERDLISSFAVSSHNRFVLSRNGGVHEFYSAPGAPPSRYQMSGTHMSFIQFYDSNAAYSVSNRGAFHCFDFRECEEWGNPVKRCPTDANPTAFSMTIDGDHLVLGHQDAIAIWDIRKLREPAHIIHQQGIGSVFRVQNNELVAAVNGESASEIVRYHLSDPSEPFSRRTVCQAPSEVVGVAFFNGSDVLSLEQDGEMQGELKYWRDASNRLVPVAKYSDIQSPLTVLTSGEQIAVYSNRHDGQCSTVKWFSFFRPNKQVPSQQPLPTNNSYELPIDSMSGLHTSSSSLR